VQIGDLIEVCRLRVPVPGGEGGRRRRLWSLSQGPGTPKSVGVLTQALTNTTDLVWAANTEPDLEGYDVVWREDHGSGLDARDPGGQLTSASFPHFSKDNCVLRREGGRQDRHHSPVAFPVPQLTSGSGLWTWRMVAAKAAAACRWRWIPLPVAAARYTVWDREPVRLVRVIVTWIVPSCAGACR